MLAIVAFDCLTNALYINGYHLSKSERGLGLSGWSGKAIPSLSCNVIVDPVMEVKTPRVRRGYMRGTVRKRARVCNGNKPREGTEAC